MVQTAKRIETYQTLKGKIVAIYEYLCQQHDLVHAEKVKQLAIKLNNREYSIAFCGHFSAGKSTMINQVIGENLLPSSPIPTSANLVKVKTGEEYAKVCFKHEKPRLYLAPYDYNLVKNYCKDGDKIEEVEISHSESKLPPNTIIMDTPGIDSADDAHRIATESAIHLADLVFYVMDYNHVQAELNFLFTKELSESGKEVYLVINQIDKHLDEELSFQDFQKSVEESFASWGVKPANIFYTSLKQKNHPFNQFQQLQEFIAETLSRKDQLLVPSIFHSLRKIALDHMDLQKKQEAEELTSLLEVLNELTDQEKQELLDKYQKLISELNSVKEGTVQTEKEFDLDISQIMKNAYLMPSETREFAETFLESCQPEFKVGFLFAKQKTEEEKNKRLNSFYQELLEKTKTQLEWHLREFLLRTLKETELDQPELHDLAQSFSISIPVELLSNIIKPGARVTGDYVLHYTEDLANEIKRIARKELIDFKMIWLEALSKQNTLLQKSYEQEFRKIEKFIIALEELTKHEQVHVDRVKAIEELLLKSPSLTEEANQLFIQEPEECEVVHSNGEVNNVVTKTEKTLEEKTIDQQGIKNELKLSENHLKLISAKLKNSSALIKDLPGFKKISHELMEKAERLDHRDFTVALFGAFSAGKSSFANALMGEKVLPVSPNPTTAAINKIKPVTDQHSHGTVLVKFKEVNTMLDDINRSLKVFDLQAGGFSEALDLIDQILLDQQNQTVLEKTHFAFLQAFKKGYVSLVPSLGTTKKAVLADFHEFVAQEEKSCYVEWIELYYDCPLTRKGITLVDTPGADSINARHTGVAFDYIKNSDAILFVTYYNHAFSKADREFLIQLGRVKESFQMDKMFFIINAIDLAENEEEKESVVEYVKDHLIKYGIRNPHLNTVSSLLALKEKTTANFHAASGMKRFEETFYQFISNDLTSMAVSSAEKELSRVEELIDTLIQNSQQDEAQKTEKRREIENQILKTKALLNNETVYSLQSRLSHEAEELIFYIKQRVFLRFGDFFKESFNPSTLRDDGRDIKKALQASLDEFLESFGFDFAQELRATTVRLDRFIDKLLMDYQERLKRSFADINGDLSFSFFENKESNQIDFPIAFSNVNPQRYRKALSYFKNPKSFFEKNEKKLMSDELLQILNPIADEYLKVEGERLDRHYISELEENFNRLLRELSDQADDFYFSILSALDGGVSVDLLHEIKQKISQ
ncbi:dynamin family protein [Neobacillus cucumis]|uniref:dynamin family protein n=1 Tax=Neobacillus cucumis TaxID=1740721 RepID=UPI0028532FCF|nr:dynamin family protein [Neobacillus cucumis]MDR4948344.1 dynamin family protein [Neobacillus cucumis]